MKIKKIYIGGWFQRTTLHLTEIWNFMKHGKSDLDFSGKELIEAKNNLAISEIAREAGLLEYILVKTDLNISYRIYEDGLIILEKDFENINEDFKAIRDYYDNRLSKSLSLIFSKGAPVPKELANIKTILPYIVTSSGATEKEIQKIFKDSSEDAYSIISAKGVKVYRSLGIILINNLRDDKMARGIIESQIFFREFKSQLHRYMDIHRIIWEKIQKIKERGEIKGNNIDKLRSDLAIYQKTVNLIGARIDQMTSYVRTRQRITNMEKIDDYLAPLFKFKFETLLDTHAYIKHLWTMTESYLNSAIELFTELQAKSTKNTISSLQLITTFGVVASILVYLGKETLPGITLVGLAYFLTIILITWAANSLVSRFYKNKNYIIKGQEIEKNIK